MVSVPRPAHSARGPGSVSGPRAAGQSSPRSSAFPPVPPPPGGDDYAVGSRRRVTVPTLSVVGRVPSSAVPADLAAPGVVRHVRRYYADVRLPSRVHVGIAATGLPRPSLGPIARGSRWGLPVLAHRASAHAQGLRLRGAGPPLAPGAAARVAFPIPERGRRPSVFDFGAQWLACAYPCPRFACGVTAPDAGRGAMVARYAFHVGLFHSSLYAGLSRRVPGHNFALSREAPRSAGRPSPFPCPYSPDSLPAPRRGGMTREWGQGNRA